MSKLVLAASVAVCIGLMSLPAHSAGDPDSDWNRRAHATGVVKAVGFDDIREWAQYNHERDSCNPEYQVTVEGKKAGCRNNAWDSSVKASGKGAVRFDILPRTGQGGGGSLAIPFGDYATAQFGANQEFWVSWRQRMDARYLQAYQRDGSGTTSFKQVIIGQGDMPLGGGRVYSGNACSEAEIVVVSTSPERGAVYPFGYIECGRYLAFEEKPARKDYLGDPRGSSAISRQNMRRDGEGMVNCIYHPRHLDRSGCMEYVPDQWMTFMVHVKMGPEGRAVSSIYRAEQPGYVDSTYELYMALPGKDFELLHRQTGVVIPKGQYYLGGDPARRESYKSGWGPGDAHPEAKYGKLWLLTYMSFKDPKQVTEKASTWYDEVIVSRCRIAAPGYPAPTECSPTTAAPSQPSMQPDRPRVSANTAVVQAESRGPVPSPAEIRRLRESSAPGPAVQKEELAPLSALQIAAVLQNLQPGHWFAFPGSEMARAQADACKSPEIWQPFVERFGDKYSCNPDQIMAYSGGAYDTKGHRLLVWGGGHAAYIGNEIYAFDVPRGRWSRLTEPSKGVYEYRFDKAAGRNVADPIEDQLSGKPAPASAHSYDQLEYLPQQDSLFLVGGSVFGTGYASGLTWLFSLTGEMKWRLGPPIPGPNNRIKEYTLSTAYDPVSGRVLLRGYAAAALYDPREDKWIVSEKSLPTRGLGTVGEIDPKRRVFVVLGNGRTEFYAVDATGRFDAKMQLATRGGEEIERCYAPGLTYDSKHERLVGWCGGGDVFSLNLENGEWTRHANKGSVSPGYPANTRGIRGTYGRFRYMPEYNAYVMVNGPKNPVFLYRLSGDRGASNIP